MDGPYLAYHNQKKLPNPTQPENVNFETGFLLHRTVFKTLNIKLGFHIFTSFIFRCDMQKTGKIYDYCLQVDFVNVCCNVTSRDKSSVM